MACQRDYEDNNAFDVDAFLSELDQEEEEPWFYAERLKYGPKKKDVQATSNNYRKHVKGCCTACGFVAIHRCQLDVDHIDGDHSNNDPANLMTLCVNCHRLKTYLQQGGKLADEGNIPARLLDWRAIAESEEGRIKAKAANQLRLMADLSKR